MSTKSHSARIGFVGLVVLIILACNLPGSETPREVTKPGATSVDLPVDTPPNAVTPDQLSVPSSTFTKIAASTPTYTPTYTPTKTSLPPLPDFENLLTFSGGAGGGSVAKKYCQTQFPGNVPAAHGGSSTYLDQIACLCIWGVPLDVVFRVELTSPNSQNTLTGTFKALSSDRTVAWSGHIPEEHDSVVYLESDANLVVISPWWSRELPTGLWKMRVTWNGREITGAFDASQNNTSVDPRITTTDPRIWTEILPSGVLENILVHPAIVGEVFGRGFSPNSIVYVLAYADEQAGGYNPVFRDFAYKTGITVATDANGNFVTSFPENLEKGRLHVIFGITDPNAVLSDRNGHINTTSIAGRDIFYFQPSAATFDLSQVANSCPGAPAQRMTVNQRGYVCTKNDAVRLRVSPNRSAGTIVQLDKGTQFTVIGGPSCADNWSWWQVRTDLGQTGWISEGGDETDPYFVCPLP